MTQRKCSECDSYQKRGFNYCRMCGYYLTKGHTKFARKAVAYSTAEKFCGGCGQERREQCVCYSAGGSSSATN